MELPKLSIISVEDLRLRAYIGFMEWETKKLQDVVISYSFKYNTAKASVSDSVEDAVDYKLLTKQIIDLVDNQSFFLIEFLAEKILEHIQEYHYSIQEISVKVEKPNALRFSDNVLVRIASEDRYNTVIISMGSNIEPEENFKKAIDLILRLGLIVKRTEFIKTAPLKFEDQPDFLNGALLLCTKKNLNELQLELKQIEAVLGRVRSENKNAPRQIDLDVTTYNGHLIDDEINELPFLTDFITYLQPEIER